MFRGAVFSGHGVYSFKRVLRVYSVTAAQNVASCAVYAHLM